MIYVIEFNKIARLRDFAVIEKEPLICVAQFVGYKQQELGGK